MRQSIRLLIGYCFMSCNSSLGAKERFIFAVFHGFGAFDHDFTSGDTARLTILLANPQALFSSINMKGRTLGRLAQALLMFGSLATRAQVGVWVTSPEESARFERQTTQLVFENSAEIPATIRVNEEPRFQSIDGFGFCLTGGSATHLSQMSSAGRNALLKELFSTDGNGIGTSYLRVTIGASDLNNHVYSYDDLPPGQTDPSLEKFSLEPDHAEMIPVLHEILTIDPTLKILGSPWSPPTWMKTNHDSVGGSLDPKFYDSYAKYFVKYIQSMQAEGIPIDAITVQNEPLHPANNPSLLMLAPEQAEFIKHHLGPAFQDAGIKTKIILYDHNADRPDYPISILDDPDARKFVDGSAFHLYRGPIEALGKVHDAHPDKKLHFTEQ